MLPRAKSGDSVWGAETRSRCEDILVNQSAETIATLDGNLVLLRKRRDRRTGRMRRLETQRSMRPVTVVVCDEISQDVLEMSFIQDQQPVETL